MKRRITARFVRTVLLVFAALPSMVFVYCLPYLPDAVPMHYGVAGNVDRLGGKWEILLLPAVNLMMAFMWIFLEYASIRRHKKRTEDLERSAKGFLAAGVVLQICYGVVNYCFLYRAFAYRGGDPPEISMVVILQMLVGVAAILIGNCLTDSFGRSGAVAMTVYGVAVILLSLSMRNEALPVNMALAIIVVVVLVLRRRRRPGPDGTD